jgi:hypothetical protein
LWERIVFLVRASGEEEALARALDLARSKEHEYVSAAGGLLRWTFQRIERCEALFDASLGEGTEVYWQFFERVDPRPNPPVDDPGTGV